MRRTGTKSEPCLLEWMEYTGEEEPGPLGWRPKPENTLRLTIPGYEGALNFGEAERLAQETLPKLRSGEIQPTESSPLTPSVSELAKLLEHPTGRGKAVISKLGDGRYEITVGIWVPDGHFMPMSTPNFSSSPDMSWCRWHNEHIYAESLSEAEAFASSELDLAVDEAVRLTREHDAGKARAGE